MYVPGLQETIISLGVLDKEGCTTQISNRAMKFFSSSGEFMFSAFLHAGRYFPDSTFYYGPVFQHRDSSMILSDAAYYNTAEFGCLCCYWLPPVSPKEYQQLFMEFSTASRGILVGLDEHRRAFRVLSEAQTNMFW